MKIISSQHYRDESIVKEKMEELRGEDKIELTVWPVGIDDLYILCNGHHTREAAIELGIEIEYIPEEHPEGLKGENLLEQTWMDGDYYDVQTGVLIW